MKKLLTACLCTCFLFAVGGCSPGTILEQFTSTGDSNTSETPSPSVSSEHKDRVYMDELSGTLQDFTGSQLLLSANDSLYTFDVSQATLECAEGVITGDPVSVIYEGQLSGTDTSTVKALKVVDNIHVEHQLEDRTAYGQVIGLTPNTITIRSRKGRTATYPITGTTQYYQNGIKAENWVYLHFKGKFPSSSDASDTLDASHLKVVSVSDIDPLVIAAPTPTPTPAPETNGTAANETRQLAVTIQEVNLNILQVLADGSDTVQNIDLSAIPAYFKGGITSGSHATVTYTGDLADVNTLSGITILSITGEDPDTIDNRHISFTVTGTILGSTANTITVQTTDGAFDTFLITEAQDLSTSGLAAGAGVSIVFHPSQSTDTNLYTAVTISDA